MSSRLSCIFCQICDKTSPATIYYEDDEVLVFKDIYPVTDFHMLCIPKNHIKSVKCLSKEDKPLLEKLISVGKQALLDNGGSENDLLMGFHWPPFNSVNHLHLHIISPASKMNFLHRQMFRTGSFWFVTSDYALEYIQNKLWYLRVKSAQCEVQQIHNNKKYR